MELATLILDFIGHLAWPATIVIVTLLFRTEIRQLLGVIRELKVPGLSLTMKSVEQQVSANIATGREDMAKRLEAVLERHLVDVDSELAKTIKGKVLDDVKEAFQTLQLQTKAVTQLLEPPATEAPSPALSPPAHHPGAVKVVRWLLRNESKYQFFSVKFVREKIFAADPVAQEGVQFAIQNGLLELYDVPNPHDPKHPTKAIRMNRHNPVTAEILRSPPRD